MDWCVEGDKTLPQRYAFMVEQEAVLEKKIHELQAQLDFLRWKKWYYQIANEAGTEKIFFKEGSNEDDIVHPADGIAEEVHDRITDKTVFHHDTDRTS